MRIETSGILVNVDRNVIVHEDREVILQPRSMDVLVYLIENRDRVVSADELLARFWADRVTEESTVHRRVSDIRRALNDTSKERRFIRTAVKRGYQYIADVTPLNVTKPTEDIDFTSIGILPFEDRSENQDLSWLADGMANGLTSRLIGLDGLYIPAQAAVERFRGTTLAPSEIATELRVGLLFHGRIFGDATSIHIYLELVNPHSDEIIWTEEFPTDEDDLIALQEQIIRQISGFLGRRIPQPNRMKLPTNKAAFTAFMKFENADSINDNDKRIEWIDKTLILEPAFAYGHLQAGWSYMMRHDRDTIEQNRARAREALTQAAELGLADDPQWLNAWGGFVSRGDREHAEAETYLRRAVAGGVYTQYAHLLIASGLAEEAVKLLRVATTRHPFMTADLNYLAAALGLSGDPAGMLEVANQCIRIAPKNLLAHTNKITAQVQLGQLTAAAKSIEQLSAIDQSSLFQITKDFFRHYLLTDDPRTIGYVATLWEKGGGELGAGKFLLKLSDTRGWDLMQMEEYTFIFDLPFHIIHMPEAHRQAPQQRAWLDEAGYSLSWRKELSQRVQTLTLG